jgi:hypothetical protein
VAVVIWSLVAIVLGLVVGMGIADADRRELKPCCPHPVSEAPETVRGEFRAIVVPLPPAQRGSRLDVRL